MSRMNNLAHTEAFQGLIKYLVKLRRDGDMDNETFDGHVRQAAANFVETKISERINKKLSKQPKI